MQDESEIGAWIITSNTYKELHFQNANFILNADFL